MSDNNGNIGPVRIDWSRVGNEHKPDPTDISDLIDMRELERRITGVVEDQLAQDFSVRFEVKVFLDGGPFAQLNFGEGRVQVELPKAGDND